MKLKTVLPFFFAILLLSMAISIPMFLSAIQDKTLLGAKTEKLTTAEQKESRKVSVSTYDRLKLIRGDSIEASLGRSSYSIKSKSEEAPLDNVHARQILKELEKLQARGGFPDFDLRGGVKCTSGNFPTCTYISNDGKEISVFIMSFTADDAVFDVWADADTYTIYQYAVKMAKDISNTVDRQTVEAFFSDYLSISEKQFKSLYSFTEDDWIELMLK